MAGAASRSVVIGARTSPLARIQAQLVGDALRRANPTIDVHYRFRDASGDRDLGADLSSILRAGGFTTELSDALRAHEIDIAVHSWKDLPFGSYSATRIAATLERADPRDLLLVRREWSRASAPRELRILTCSARRRINVAEFVEWALPARPERVSFAPVRGDIPQRLAKLLRGDGDALVVAKAAIDRLLAAAAPTVGEARAQVNAALAACDLMVLPLAANPAAPGQGALAIELRRNDGRLEDIVAPINHIPSYDRVRREREQLAATADEDHPAGVSIVPIGCGDVEFLRGRLQGERVDSARLHRNDAPLPRAARTADVWTGEARGSELFERLPITSHVQDLSNPSTGLLVARAEALPTTVQPSADQIVWTAGLDTWRRLAARGIWVHGSDESLGETGARASRALFPHVSRWLKLTHLEGFTSAHATNVATYRLARRAPLDDVRARSHFYWRSGSQFMEYLRANPMLSRAWHGCGPGNTLSMIRKAIGPQQVRAFLSVDHFRQEVLR